LHSKRVKAFYLNYLADPKRSVTTTAAMMVKMAAMMVKTVAMVKMVAAVMRLAEKAVVDVTDGKGGGSDGDSSSSISEGMLVHK
jgi:hypothetical protein